MPEYCRAGPIKALEITNRYNPSQVLAPDPSPNLHIWHLRSQIRKQRDVSSQLFVVSQESWQTNSAAVFFIYPGREDERGKRQMLESVLGVDPWPPGVQEAQKEEECFDYIHTTSQTVPF